MNKQLKDIITFMTSFGQEVKSKIGLPSERIINLRKKLAIEELNETITAIRLYSDFLEKVKANKDINGKKITLDDYAENYKEIFDGIIDQIVILAGTANAYGATNDDEHFSYFWDEALNVHFNNTNNIKFTFPNLLDNNRINEILEGIKYNILSLNEYSVLAYTSKEDLDISYIKKNLNITLINILSLANSCGIEDRILFEKIWDEIQSSNMSKLDNNGKPIYREDGKILKSESYFKPNIKKILLEYIK